MKKKPKLLLDYLFYSILFLIGTTLFVVNMYKVSKYEPLLWKPTTTGTIAHSSISYKRVDSYDLSYDLYVPHITFLYSADGQKYMMSAVENDAYFRVHDVESMIADYPVDMEIPVYYPPGKPVEAIFQSGIGNQFNGTRAYMKYAFAGLLLAIVMLYAIIRNDSYSIDRTKDIPVPDPYQRFFVGTTYTHGTPNYDRDES